MKTILLAALFLFSALTSFAQEYFFYHFKDKMVLSRNYNYLTIKFKQNTSRTEIDKVYSKIALYAEKRMDFRAGMNDFKKTDVLIVKIKDNIDAGMTDIIRGDIKNIPSVDYTGMCFRYNDKVLHFSTDEVIVKFNKNVSESDIRNLNSLYKTSNIEKVSTFENTYLVSINHEGLDNVFDVANKYTVTNMVEFAQPNFIRSSMLLEAGNNEEAKVFPNDSLAPYMWHLKNIGSNIPQNVPGTPGCDANLEPAWNITTGNPNILIAITDTGVDTNHADLRGNLCDRSLWYDAYDNNQKPYDQYYHGTGVSGLPGAIGNNNIGTVGTAFSCKLMPVRVFGPAPYAFTTDLILAKGLNWAWTHGASVINCSWGGGIPTPLITHAILNAVHYGRNGRGTVIFGGTGNADTNIVIYPASMPEVIGVGGLSPCNERKNRHSCDFTFTNDSNMYWGASYGEGLSVVASCTFVGTTTLLGGWCICGNGTSVSSPLASGIGALILSKNNQLSGDSVKIIIEQTAKKVGNYSYNIQKENGMWNNEMGYGRIDAKACLDATPNGTGGEIYEQVPPIIKIYPPESRIFNSQIKVSADIYDLTGLATGGNMPRLYYRTLQNSSIQVINGVKVSEFGYDFTFPVIPVSEGLFYYIAAQDQVPVPNFVTYPIGGAGVNPPGFIPPPKLMFVRNTAAYDTLMASNNVPIPITSNSETTFVSVLNNPVAKTVLDVDCNVEVEHTYDADLTLSLISPAGTEIVLVSGVGAGVSNFTNTTFDDEAGVSIDSSLAKAPFTGTFKPLEKLWLFDGENSAGEWKLKVVDNGYADGGKLLNWNIKFKYADGSDNVTIPGNFSLVKNYPNPFNPVTRIVFNVPKQAKIKITVYDVTGSEIKTVLNEVRQPMLEDYVDFNAGSLASGVYFYSLVADGEFIEAKRMVFVK